MMIIKDYMISMVHSLDEDRKISLYDLFVNNIN